MSNELADIYNKNLFFQRVGTMDNKKYPPVCLFLNTLSL